MENTALSPQTMEIVISHLDALRTQAMVNASPEMHAQINESYNTIITTLAPVTSTTMEYQTWNYEQHFLREAHTVLDEPVTKSGQYPKFVIMIAQDEHSGDIMTSHGWFAPSELQPTENRYTFTKITTD